MSAPAAFSLLEAKKPEGGNIIGQIVNVSAGQRVLGEDGKIDAAKLQAISFDPCANTYVKICQNGRGRGQGVPGRGESEMKTRILGKNLEVSAVGLGCMVFSPMANGLLTGKYDQNSRFEAGTDYRGVMPQFAPEAFEQNRALLELIHSTAQRKNAAPAQLSLAWMLCKKPWIVPIPGSRKVERLKENAGAAKSSCPPPRWRSWTGLWTV